MEQLTAVAIVLGLLGASLWFLQRKRLSPWVSLSSRRTAVRQLEIVERVALTTQHSLALVRANGQMMLVGTGPGVCEIRDVESAS